MKKCLFYCLFVLFLAGNLRYAYSQVVAEDSISIWMSFSESQLKQSPQTSALYARKALDYARQFNQKEKIAATTVQLGKAMIGLNNPDSAKALFQDAIKLALAQRDSVQAGLAYNGLGVIYIMSRPNYAQALQELRVAHHLTRRDSSKLVIVINSLANLFKRTLEYDTALFLYKKVLGYSQRHGNLALASDAINNVGSVYTNRGDYALAISWLQKSVSIKKSINDWDGATRSLLNIGMSYVDLKEFSKAEEILTEALGIIEKHQFNFLEVLCIHIFAELNYQKGEFDKAFKYAEKSESLCNLYGTDLFRKRIYELRSDLYEATGDHAKSLFYKKRVANVMDSMAKSERKAMLSAQNNLLMTTTVTASDNRFSYFVWIFSSILLIGAFSLVVWFKRRNVTAYRANEDFGATQVEPSSENLSALSADTFSGQKSDDEIKTIEVIDGPGLKLLSFDEINWFQKEEKYYFVYANDGSERYRVRQTLEELEDLLPTSSFFRINRAVIVNIESIANYSFWENRKYILRTKSKHEFTISSARLKELKNTLNVLNDSTSER